MALFAFSDASGAGVFGGDGDSQSRLSTGDLGRKWLGVAVGIRVLEINSTF
jgi:hypothetical protein